MRLRRDQLAAQLAKELLPVYLITGDEPLQLMEAADAVRERARALGYTEREVMQVEPGFDWGALQAASDSLSLFAEQRIIDLRLPTGKPGVQGGKALEAYAERPAEDTVLLIQAGKLDKGALNAKWAKALERVGALIQVWPLSAAETPRWVAQRMRSRGLKPMDDAVKLLTDKVEGNLLAAAQEIDKLSLLCGPGARVDVQTVVGSVADSARYNVYDLADAALQGDAERGVKILNGLRGEGVEPVLILWSLTREVRSLTSMADELARGASADRLLQSVWQKRRPLVKRALQRQSAKVWRDLLHRCALADRVIKGQAAGSVWDELLQLVLGISGKPLFKDSTPQVAS